MEEIILMGLKDKQVRGARQAEDTFWIVTLMIARDTFRSGTTTSPTRYEAV
jgi:hypothetical protein